MLVSWMVLCVVAHFNFFRKTQNVLGLSYSFHITCACGSCRIPWAYHIQCSISTRRKENMNKEMKKKRIMIMLEEKHSDRERQAASLIIYRGVGLLRFQKRVLNCVLHVIN